MHSAIFKILIFSVFAGFANVYCMSTNSDKELRTKLLAYASGALVKQCESKKQGLRGTEDSLMYAEPEQLETKHYKYLKLQSQSVLAIIIGCGDSGELLLVDSAMTGKVFSRSPINIPGRHVAFDDIQDLNKDGVLELRINFSAGAHGMYASFVSLFADSAKFLLTENGNDKFFALRGGIKVIDNDKDGVFEIQVGDPSVSKEGAFTIYKWTGNGYKVSNDAEK